MDPDRVGVESDRGTEVFEAGTGHAHPLEIGQRLVDRHVQTKRGELAEEMHGLLVLPEDGGELVRAAHRDLPVGSRLGDQLQTGIAGEHSRRRLRPPSRQTRHPVGGVTDQSQVVGYGLGMDPEFLHHRRLVETFCSRRL